MPLLSKTVVIKKAIISGKLKCSICQIHVLSNQTNYNQNHWRRFYSKNGKYVTKLCGPCFPIEINIGDIQKILKNKKSYV